MENYLYTCGYCNKEYKPNKRQKQKYCSDSCRVRAFNIRKANSSRLPSKKAPNKIEQMSFAGVGNTVAGVVAVDLAKSLFTREENKPATKKDLKNLLNSLKQRYYPILNMPIRFDGAKPYYDLETNRLVYFTN